MGSGNCRRRPAPIHESRLRLGYLLKASRSAGRWWSSDKADWKSVVVTWSGRRLYPLHWMARPAAVGTFLLAWGIFTAYMTVAATTLSRPVLVVFILLTITFFVLAIGAFSSQ